MADEDPDSQTAGSKLIAKTVATRISPLTSERPPIAKPISLVHRVWPVAGVVAAMMVNLAWMDFLGFGFFKLVKPIFF
jgi:hypothetical protein